MERSTGRPRGGATNLTIRVTNERRVLDALRSSTSPELSQSDLVRATGLSHPTVSSIVETLDGSFVHLRRPTRRVTPTGGRPPHLVSLAANSGVAIGIDFGRSHVRVALTDISRREIEVSPRRDDRVDVELDPERGLESAIRQMKRMLKARGLGPEQVMGIGVGVPVPVDHEREELATWGDVRGWRGLRPAEEIRDRLGWNVPVMLGNDANLAALAEHEFGAAQGARDVLYVKWSSGIGAAIISDGRLLMGRRGIAAELGHIPVSQLHNKEPCFTCGMHCLESVAGWASLARTQRIDDLAQLVRELLESGTRSRKLRRWATERAALLGEVLGPVITLLNPERVVIGGVVDSSVFPVIRDTLNKSLRASTTESARAAATVVPGAFPREACARGAALFALDRQIAGYLDRRLGERAGRTRTP